MKEYSASRLGRLVGLGAREVNLKLKELGLLDGNPGDWSLTDEGKQYGEVHNHSNGYGGYAARGWGFILWDIAVAYLLGDPEAHMAEVNEARKSAGLPPVEFPGNQR